LFLKGNILQNIEKLSIRRKDTDIKYF